MPHVARRQVLDDEALDNIESIVRGTQDHLVPTDTGLVNTSQDRRGDRPI